MAHDPDRQGGVDRGTVTAGQAARAAGVSRKALRVYEQKGLVAPIGRTAAGYRLFTETEIEELRFIRCARVLGLALDDIAPVLARRNVGEPTCEHVADRLAVRLQKIDDAIRELCTLRERVAVAADECAGRPSGSATCPLIDHTISTSPERCCE